jgi:hypothetical protein
MVSTFALVDLLTDTLVCESTESPSEKPDTPSIASRMSGKIAMISKEAGDLKLLLDMMMQGSISNSLIGK